MRLSVASSALAAAFVLTPGAAGYAPALCQDFSITNQVEPANAGHRDVMRQLQVWWAAHDTAGASVFREGFVRPFPQGEPKAEIDISLHYVLAHRHDQPVAAGYT